MLASPLRFIAAFLACLLAPAWAGAEGFAGLWQTPYGRLRLVEAEGRYGGAYDYSGGGEVSGAVKDGELVVRYKDAASGDATFRLSEDGRSLKGRWRADGADEWSSWDGVRLEPDSGRRWLYVVESRWEENLADREYTYGQMLKTFFDYSAKIEVRQRSFSDRNSLLRWLRQAAFLAEPVVVYVSAHGAPEGVETDSGHVGGEDIGAALRWAPTVELLHFGSCEVMKGSVPERIRARQPPGRRFPISGFTESVDWAGSALADMMYLHLVLDQGLAPARAAKELKRLLPYTVRPAPPIGPIGFTLR